VTPLIDDRVQAIGNDVRELARLHGELAHHELRRGWTRLVAGLFLLGFGVAAGLLVVVLLSIASVAFLAPRLGTAGSAATIALIDAVIAGAALWLGIRMLRGAADLSLPRTRTMLWELFTWRDPPTNS